MKHQLYVKVRAILDACAIDGSADTFTPEVFERTFGRLALAALAALALAALLFTQRGRIARAVRWLAASTGAAVRALAAEASAAWSAETGVHRALVLGVLAVGTLARVALLDLPIRYDESMAYCTYSRPPVWYLLVELDTPGNHILHSLLVKICDLVFGTHPWAIRLPALLAGIVALPLTYMLARRLSDRWTGLTALVFVATLPYLVHASTNSRSYMIITTFWLILALLEPLIAGGADQERAGAWVLFVAVSVAGFYMVPVMLYPYTALLIWLAARLHPQGRVREVIVAGAATVVVVLALYAPTLVRHTPAEIAQLPMWRDKLRKLPFDQFLASVAVVAEGARKTWFTEALGPLIMVAGALGALSHRFLAVPVLVTAAMLCWQRVMPPERVLTFLLVPWCIGAARLMCFGRAPLAVTWLVASLYFLPDVRAAVIRVGEFHFPDAKAALAKIREVGLEPSDQVVVAGFARVPLRFYFYEMGLDYPRHAGAHLVDPKSLLTARRVYVIENRHRPLRPGEDPVPPEAYEGRSETCRHELPSSVVRCWDRR